MNFGAGLAHGFVTPPEANWSKSSFCLVTFSFRRPKDIMRRGMLCEVASVSACQSGVRRFGCARISANSSLERYATVGRVCRCNGIARIF